MEILNFSLKRAFAAAGDCVSAKETPGLSNSKTQLMYFDADDS